MPSRHSRSAPSLAGPWGDPPPFAPLPASARAALARLYEEAEAALAPVAAACRACGRCCRFEPGGIVLFASALELAYLVAETGGVPGACPSCGGPPLPGHAARRIGGPWRCPYQEGDRCSARSARLLGCRTYFCDAEARAAGEGLYAGALREIQRMTEGQGPWWYGPARLYLDRSP